MSILDTARADFSKQMGPLPLYGWLAVAGLGYAAYRVIKKSGSANTATGGVPSGGETGATGANGPPVTLQPNQSVYSPSSGSISTAPGIKATDLLGGSLKDFLSSLGPNYNSFSFTQGDTSVGVANSAQNVLDAQNYQSYLSNATQQALNTENYTAYLYGTAVPNILNSLSAGGFPLAAFNNLGPQINPTYSPPQRIGVPIGR